MHDLGLVLLFLAALVGVGMLADAFGRVRKLQEQVDRLQGEVRRLQDAQGRS